jgi:hypothetical protein
VPKNFHLSYKLKQRGDDIIKTHVSSNIQFKIEKLVEDYSRTLQLKNIHNSGGGS